jgi:hypothetical protein
MNEELSQLGRHPLPASPIKGEVQLRSWGMIVSPPPADTSPLMGEVRRGWGSHHASAQSREVRK